MSRVATSVMVRGERVPLTDGWVLRDGVLCGCRDLHGSFPECVGSRSPYADWLGLSRPKAMAVARRRRAETANPVDSGLAIHPSEFKRRRRLPFGRAEVEACDGCVVIHEGWQYCEEHRELAVQNVLAAAAKDRSISRLHLMVAERFGLDPVTDLYPAPVKERTDGAAAKVVR